MYSLFVFSFVCVLGPSCSASAFHDAHIKAKQVRKAIHGKLIFVSCIPRHGSKFCFQKWKPYQFCRDEIVITRLIQQFVHSIPVYCTFVIFAGLFRRAPKLIRQVRQLFPCLFLWETFRTNILSLVWNSQMNFCPANNHPQYTECGGGRQNPSVSCVSHSVWSRLTSR